MLNQNRHTIRNWFREVPEIRLQTYYGECVNNHNYDHHK